MKMRQFDADDGSMRREEDQNDRHVLACSSLLLRAHMRRSVHVIRFPDK